jgi:predicted dehydrogenase
MARKPAATKRSSVFKSSKRIRLGIWGLGRGMSFYRTCQHLNIDVVAGCDYNQHMRDNFLRANPGAFATDNADEFLKQDLDAVLLATFCPAHADDAVRCLAAGKHVLSEVTSFHTLAEGVRLVEAVEKCGKVYQLAENYPFSAANMWLQKRWQAGLFGQLQYGEYEYVHECRTLAYTYIDGTPINPGNRPHHWRSWLNSHYYNTHSLGPMMYITGQRPTRVTALPCQHALPGYLMTGDDCKGGATPSLIAMSGGGVVRNLMGATTNDTHSQRMWGTLGSFEIVDGSVRLRLGASGCSPRHEITPHWEGLGELAARTGHGGGDFWTLYYFARQIFEGTPGPFDIYGAADCTIPGLLAYRSQRENGTPYDVPDFRDPRQRDACRNDHYAQPRYDVENGLFPPGADEAITRNFSVTMRDLIKLSTTYRAFRDWRQVADDCKDPTAPVQAADALIEKLTALQTVQKAARAIIGAYPQSDGARVLGEMLALTDESASSKPAFGQWLKEDRRKLAAAASKRGAIVAAVTAAPPAAFVTNRWQMSRLQPRPAGGLAKVAAASSNARKLGWKSIHGDSDGFVNAHTLIGDKDGIVYLTRRVLAPLTGMWNLRIGHDGGAKVFVDGKAIHLDARQINPAPRQRATLKLRLTAGWHDLTIALDTNQGAGWGVFVRFEVPRDQRRKNAEGILPL